VYLENKSFKEKVYGWMDGQTDGRIVDDRTTDGRMLHHGRSSAGLWARWAKKKFSLKTHYYIIKTYNIYLDKNNLRKIIW